MKILYIFLFFTFLNANYEILYNNCENGDGNSCKKLIFDLEKNCLKNNEKFCAVLAQIYEKGLNNIKRDFKKAEFLYKKSCEKGITSSCNFLGDMLLFGKGIPQNLDQALKIYNTACQNGFLKSCVSLASMYEDGNGVEQNITKAFYIYKNSCKQGDKISCVSISQMVKDGKISENEMKARMYFD